LPSTINYQLKTINELIQQLINGLALGSILALIALGYTMVYGILRFINFAHGDIFMLGAFAGFYLAPKVATVLPTPPNVDESSIDLENVYTALIESPPRKRRCARICSAW